MEGQIALVERGDCSFVSKVIRKANGQSIHNHLQVIKAQEAGAVGVIVADRVIFASKPCKGSFSFKNSRKLVFLSALVQNDQLGAKQPAWWPYFKSSSASIILVQ